MQVPVSERLVRVAAIAFGLWTVTTHAVVAFGGSLHLLLGLVPLVLGATVVACRQLPAAPARVSASTVVAADPWARTLASALAAVTVGLYLLGGSPNLFWWCIIACLLCGVAVALRGPARTLPVSPRPALTNLLREHWLWGLSAASASFALLLHRPENDDGMYVATAARAVDDPGAPLLATNPTLGIADLPQSLPAYKVHTLELFAAAISWFSSVPVIGVFHLVIGPIVAALMPLAYASLYRRLLPNHVLRATAITLGIMVLFPRTPYGGDQFAHPWIGNTVFLALLVPLLGVAAWDLAQAPTTRRFFALTLTQIAAIGTTSTALWAAPVTVTYFGVAALAAPAPTARRLRAGMLGLASCGYAVAAGLMIRSALVEFVSPIGPSLPTPFLDLGVAISEALGSPMTTATIWAGVLAGWAWQRHRPARDVALVIPALFAVTLMNPYISAFVGANITSTYVYERVFWVLPVPVLLTLLIHALVESARGWRRPAKVALVAAGILGVASASVWQGFTRHGWNNLAILRFPPGLKVPHPSYDVAAYLHRTLGPGKTVLGGRWVSLWLPTFHDPPFPLATRNHYLDSLRFIGEDRQVVQRLLLGAFLGGEIEAWKPFPEPIPDLMAFMEEGLLDLRADAVFLSPRMADREDVRELLRRTGYRYSESVEGYPIWLVLPAERDPQDPGPG